MERRPGVVVDIFSTVTNNGGYQDGVDPKPPKKKRSPLHILRVANYMLSLKSGKSKTAHTDVVSKWKKLLSSMRPLHINSSQSTPRSIGREKVPMATLTSKDVYEPSEAFEDVEQLEVLTPPWSPAPKSTAGSSSGQTSQYASAQNLQELDDQRDEDDEDDSYYDDKYGDEMIDMKAEEFIAKFYDQMKFQHRS
ncbi:COTTON FIBER PROTEIN [Salix viminalis]|uniref:COTTON FIBER PROTEIN n=1 Tax=Salix viminalis TaxID=40686 RepID=A0A9Q0NS91_SALVM|nr:COTTON FIBER PROTEIN [Salix viminalis]